MADIAVTASQLLPTADTVLEDGTAGEAIAQGDWLYKKAADSRLYKADNDAASAEAAEVVGQAMVACAAAAQPMRYGRGGTITQGAAATIVQGTIYVLSSTAGKAMPAADLGAGDRVTILGVGNAANGIQLQLNRSGITV